ncbi:MAG: hypothetical protein AAF581_18045 [Planctomycetota bacterium]
MTDSSLATALSMLHRRALVTAALIVVVVLVAMLAPSGARFVMPGELTDHHAAIGTDCGQCHVGPDGRTKPLSHGLHDPSAALAESDLCGSCHDLGVYHLQAHSASPATLAQLTAQIQDPQSPAVAAETEIACSSCHREHQGRQFDLTAVTNQRCQSCHSQHVHQFATDHPKLGEYPYARRTRIIFDHGKHRARYFPEQSEEFACESCHELDPTGRYMVTAGFDKACASCHAEQIHGAGRSEPGLVFLQLPGVDVESLAAGGYDCGDWPATAEEMIDFPMSPFAEALLAGDARYPEWRRDRGQLQGLDLYELEDASADELAAAARLVGATRRLVDRLATSSLAELAAQFEAAFGEGGAELLDHLPLQEFTPARAWFPSSTELSAEETAARAREQRSWGRSASGAWYRSDEDFAISYQPTRHDDPFLRAWIDLAVRTNNEQLQQLLLVEDRRCTKCHSVDRSTSGGVVHWQAFTPPAGSLATRFRHAPHLPVAGPAGCEDCHRVRSGEGYLASFDPLLPSESFVPDFEGMTRQQCLPCHDEEHVGGGCVRCHSYHVGHFPPALRKQ